MVGPIVTWEGCSSKQVPLHLSLNMRLGGVRVGHLGVKFANVDALGQMACVSPSNSSVLIRFLSTRTVARMGLDWAAETGCLGGCSFCRPGSVPYHPDHVHMVSGDSVGGGGDSPAKPPL